MKFRYEGDARVASPAGIGISELDSRGDKPFGQKETKECFVVLHRLDEKLLNQYLGKDSNRKRKKIRPLYYTVDEADPVEAKPLKNCSENDRRAQVNLQAVKDSKEMGCELAGRVEGMKEELPVELVYSNLPPGGVEYYTSVDNDIEIIKEFPKSFRGNVICDKAICDVKFITQDESNPELNDQDESRDDSEDDRSTVIFEKDTDLDVFELEEKEITNKFKKKKITNRKKQKLVKFKRKSMTGRNLGKIRKSKSKVSESGGASPDAAEKSEKSLSDCITEDKLREVCILVRRLHEMYKIILQLQKEMPKDTELTYHFKRVINAQRENFHREIRKSQKIIIKSFEKMLKSTNKNLDKVASAVGKRAYLTAEEVIYVLSLCILTEGSYDVEKSRSDSVENTEQPKSSPSSVNRRRNTKKATQTKSCKSKVQPQEVVIIEGPSAAPPLRACTPPMAVSDHPIGQESAQSQTPIALVPNSEGQDPRACPQPCNNHQQEKPNQASSILTQQNFDCTRINNSGMRQFRETDFPQVVRQSAPSTQLPSTMPYYCNVPYTNQNTVYPPEPRPPAYCTHYASTGHYQRSNNLPPAQGRTSGLPFHLPSQRECNYVPDKRSANQTFDSPGLVQGTLGYGAAPNRISESNQPLTLNSVPTITQRSGAFTNLEKLRCNVSTNDKEVILIPPVESQCHLDFTNPIGCHNTSAEKPLHERLTVPAGVGYSSSQTNPTAKTTPEVSEILDPTIPQKLTMKNCRLQAGPTLGRVKSSEERNKCGASENPGEEHFRSRTYICAEDDCKNPGVMICYYCQSVIYCSKTCQEKHWKLKHKAECCQLKELRG